jgi:hypothetical protein
MKRLLDTVHKAQELFKKELEKVAASPEGLTEAQYVRYLTMQYHLTRGVQRHFFRIAAHPDLSRRRSFRKFLLSFGNEEELHFEIARTDLKQLGLEPTECPLDVTLWWAYFDSIVDARPFLRLGGTAVLENIAGKSGPTIQKLFARAKYITEKNSRFLVMHQHDESLPHGDQILDALKEAGLEPQHWADLVKGAEIATVLYLRMCDWALRLEDPKSLADFGTGLIAA